MFSVCFGRSRRSSRNAELSSSPNLSALAKPPDVAARDRVGSQSRAGKQVPDVPVTISITVRSEGFGANSDGLVAAAAAVLESAAQPILQFVTTDIFDDDVLEIVVERDASASGPLAYYERDASGAYRVRLCTEDGPYWCQFVFQFAHELVHILSGYYLNQKNDHKWLEEVMCEVGSLFTLRAIGSMWERFPPVQGGRQYAKNFASYAEDRIRADRESGIVEGPAALFVRENLDDLGASPVRSRRIQVCAAIELLPLFETNPAACWRAVTMLNRWRNPRDADKCIVHGIGDIVRRWRGVCPGEPERGAVTAIARVLGLEYAAHVLPATAPARADGEVADLRVTEDDFSQKEDRFVNSGLADGLLVSAADGGGEIHRAVSTHARRISDLSERLERLETLAFRSSSDL